MVKPFEGKWEVPVLTAFTQALCVAKIPLFLSFIFSWFWKSNTTKTGVKPGVGNVRKKYFFLVHPSTKQIGKYEEDKRFGVRKLTQITANFSLNISDVVKGWRFKLI